MSAKIQLNNLAQDIKTASDETQALKAFKAFTEHVFINHKLYQPEVHRKNTWKRWMTDGKKIIKAKFPEIQFPKIWFNRAEIFNADGDEAMAQALKDACRKQNKTMHNHIWGADEPKPEVKPGASPVEPTEIVESPETTKSPIDEVMDSEAVQAAMSRTGLDRERFIVEAIYEYAKAHQSKSDELSKLSTEELKGSKKAGHGEALCERAVKAVMEHNATTKDTNARYQITFTVIKRLTGCSTSVVERVLGNPTKGIQGTMADEIAEHHQSLEIISKVYNRGKLSVTDYIVL